jgi:hypothetical protein
MPGDWKVTIAAGQRAPAIRKTNPMAGAFTFADQKERMNF